MNRADKESGGLGNSSVDVRLTALGRRQSAKLADAFVADRLPKLDRMYCSLMQRAVQTAEPIAQALQMPVYGHLELFEVGGMFTGSYSAMFTGANEGAEPYPGMSASELMQLNPHLVLPEGVTEEGWYRGSVETITEAWQRAQRVVAQLHTEFGATDQVIGLVAHEWISQYVIMAAMGVGPDADAMLASWFDINNTGTVLLDFPGHRTGVLPEARWINRTDHLDASELTD